MKGYIYKIVPKDEKDKHIYIGSTNESLKIRIEKHKNNALEYPNRKVYKYITENGGWDQFEIKMIEEIEYENDTELKIKEEEYRASKDQELLLNSVRSYTGCTTRKEYRQKYKEYISKQWKKWYNENKNNRLQKVECNICGNFICKNSLKKHQGRKSCQEAKKIYDFIHS